MYKKKIKKLILGSNNKGKVREIRGLIPKHVIINTPKNLNIKSPKETGSSFLENSLIKAKYFSKKTKTICLADDSGLEIDLLEKLPGIYSARWGGRNLDFKKAIKGPAKIIDGDTIEVKREKIRLFGIDAPEMKQICTNKNSQLLISETNHLKKKYKLI